MKLNLPLTLAVLWLLVSANWLHARQMECSYDYVTHLHVVQLSEVTDAGAFLNSTSWNEISPTGGKELYLFETSPTSKQQENNSFVKLSDVLFFGDWGYVDAIYLIDFERATMKELQFPAQVLRNADENMHLFVLDWDCHRLD